MSGRGSGGVGEADESSGAVAGEPAPGGAFGDLRGAGGAGEWNAVGQVRLDSSTAYRRIASSRCAAVSSPSSVMTSGDGSSCTAFLRKTQ